MHYFIMSAQKYVSDSTTTACHLRHRDREPSRIQAKWLTRKFGKSRLSRKCLRHKIKRSVLRSSHLHYILDNLMHCQAIRMKCSPDVYCPNRSAKDLKFYICKRQNICPPQDLVNIMNIGDSGVVSALAFHL